MRGRRIVMWQLVDPPSDLKTFFREKPITLDNGRVVYERYKVNEDGTKGSPLYPWHYVDPDGSVGVYGHPRICKYHSYKAVFKNETDEKTQTTEERVEEDEQAQG